MDVKNAERIVIKVGTSTLTYETGKLNLRRIEHLARVICSLKNMGKEVILVSSGAIVAGMSKLGMEKRPESTREKQAAAAVGQCELINIYGKFFSEYGYNSAQILLTKDIIDHDTREKNAINTFSTLLELGTVPIVNENDSISTEEIEFGDNDTLSAIVAMLTKAQVLIILSDIDGMYDSDPRKNEEARLMRVIKDIDDSILNMAGGSGSYQGTGGMQTKVHAAQIATAKGIDVIIANGEHPDILYDIIDGKAVGTKFVGREQPKC